MCCLSLFGFKREKDLTLLIPCCLNPAANDLCVFSHLRASCLTQNKSSQKTFQTFHVTISTKDSGGRFFIFKQKTLRVLRKRKHAAVRRRLVLKGTLMSFVTQRLFVAAGPTSTCARGGPARDRPDDENAALCRQARVPLRREQKT